MHIPENPFRRRETCGGCAYGLVAKDLFDPEAISIAERSNRTYVLDDGFLECSQLRLLYARNNAVRAQAPCKFEPTRYTPVKEGLPDRLCRYVIRADGILGAFLERVFQL